MVIEKVVAKVLEVVPALIRGYEADGLVFFTEDDAPVVGAQCANCHTILWSNARTNSIFNEERPSGVPEFGDGYREYYFQTISRFLESMPNCPTCGGRRFDRFINNVNFPRFANGKEFPKGISDADVLEQDPDSTSVYLVT